jgi:hypothetical protein
VRTSLGRDLISVTVVRQSASVDRVEGVAGSSGERVGGNDDVWADLHLNGVVAVCGLDTGTVVLLSGVAARGSR